MPGNQPRFHQRAFNHDYRAPFIYHIILKKKDECEAFGAAAGNAMIPPGQTGCAFIRETTLGRTIAKAIIRLPFQFPILQLYQFVVMPDHIHLLLRVKNWSEYHLDYYINQLVTGIGCDYSKIIGKVIKGEEIFVPGYCDKPLLLGRNLDGLYRYIRENPHRLAMRRQFPEFFRRVRNLTIAGQNYEAYGNLFLFRNPDKAAVKISSKFTREELEHKREGWLTSASKGAVLVSPFISKDEKALRHEAEALGAKFILITHQAFGERFKPSAADFKLCEQGRLLIISLGKPAGSALSREVCLQMNDLAAVIAAM